RTVEWNSGREQAPGQKPRSAAPCPLPPTRRRSISSRPLWKVVKCLYVATPRRSVIEPSSRGQVQAAISGLLASKLHRSSQRGPARWTDDPPRDREGREFYVGVLGNLDPIAFPPIEIDFSGLPEGTPHVMDAKAKWDKDSAEYKGTKVVVADVADELKARL